MIQSDLYQVWFAANQLVKKENVDYYALVRAAEVTKKAGKSFFEVQSGQDVGKTIRYVAPGIVTAASNGNVMAGTVMPATESAVTEHKTLLMIRLVKEKTNYSYNAEELLMGAQQAGLKLQGN